MIQHVNVNIDGFYIRAMKGASVLDAALEYGICIPHLCRVPELPDIGACRLCIVEHVQNGRMKITTSCTLRVQEGYEGYRPKPQHLARSLHKEGRAIDVTCKEMSLEELARLCWVAGFDWVFHEPDHVHCSVRR